MEPCKNWSYTWSYKLDVENDERCVLWFNAVIFGMKNGFKVVGDLIKSIYGNLDENLNSA